MIFLVCFLFEKFPRNIRQAETCEFWQFVLPEFNIKWLFFLSRFIFITPTGKFFFLELGLTISDCCSNWQKEFLGFSKHVGYS